MTCFTVTLTPQPTAAAVALKQKETIQSARSAVGWIVNGRFPTTRLGSHSRLTRKDAPEHISATGEALTNLLPACDSRYLASCGG
jgi:hypothetical protein